MANLPDGIDYRAIRYAIAWEMTILALREKSAFINAEPDKRLKMLIEAYSKAYEAVQNPVLDSDS